VTLPGTKLTVADSSPHFLSHRRDPTPRTSSFTCAYVPIRSTTCLPACLPACLPTTVGQGYASSRFFHCSDCIFQDASVTVTVAAAAAAVAIAVAVAVAVAAATTAVMLGSLRYRSTRDRLGNTHCPALHRSAPHRTVLRRAAPRCAAPRRTAPHRSVGSSRVVVVVVTAHLAPATRSLHSPRRCSIIDTRCCFLAILATVSTPGAAILYTDTCFASRAGDVTVLQRGAATMIDGARAMPSRHADQACKIAWPHF